MSTNRQDEPRQSTPVLGRAVAIGLAALVLMVALGIVWIWRKAERERQWRERINAEQPIVPQRSPNPQ